MRSLRLADIANRLAAASSSADLDHALNDLIELVIHDEELTFILARYDPVNDTLKSIYKDLIRDGFGISVNELWLPATLLATDASLEYILYHHQNKLPLPAKTLKTFIQPRRQTFVDAEQERRVTSWRQPHLKVMSVMLAIYVVILLLILSYFSGTVIEKAVKWILFGLGVAYLVTFLGQMLTYRAAFGRKIYRYMARMRHLSHDSLVGPLSSLAFVMAIYGLGVILAALLLHKSWSYIGIFMLAHAFVFSITRWLPPFVVLLSCSNSQVIFLAKKINSSILPLQATSLTELAHRAFPGGGISRIRTLRRLPGRPWMETVEEVMDIAKLIILDTRGATSAVLDEAEAVQRLGYQFKTVLIVPTERFVPESTAPTAAVLGKLRLEALSLSEDRALSLVRFLRQNLTICPERTRPLAEVVKSESLGSAFDEEVEIR